MTAASFLITVFNGDDYIEQCVQSACAQTMEDFEIVVIDDGSTDLTAAKLDKLSDPRLKIVHCDRMGRGRALNFGLGKCASPYIAILDADDVALPERLRLQIDFLDQNPDVAIVGSRYRVYIDEQGHATGLEDVAPIEHDDIIAIIKKYKRNPLFHSSIMFRKDAIQSLGGYDETLSCFFDFDLYVRVIVKFKAANIDARLSLKRRHRKQFFAGQDGVYSSYDAQDAMRSLERRIDETL